MEKIIKGIRQQAKLSQTDFGFEIGASFSTINRWENGKAFPNTMAQMRLYEYAKKNSLDLYKLILDKIDEEVAGLNMEENRLVLFHGSKAGIKGDIKPISRSRCDFGQGFYMGDMAEQALTLISDFEESRFYILSIDMKDLKSLEIATDMDWAMFVAYNRGKLEAVRGTSYYNRYKDLANDADLIIGNIANDRMYYVLDNFFQGNITDQALLASLKALNLGAQYVAVSEKACKAIRIEKEIEISLLEKKYLQAMASQRRQEGISLANDICRQHRREGFFFDEIIEGARGEV